MLSFSEAASILEVIGQDGEANDENDPSETMGSVLHA